MVFIILIKENFTVKKVDALKQAIQELRNIDSWTQVSDISDNLAKSNIYLKKIKNIFFSKDIEPTGDTFKKDLFDWYKSNLVNSLYIQDYENHSL